MHSQGAITPFQIIILYGSKKIHVFIMLQKVLEAMKKMGSITQIEYHLGNAYEGLHDAYQLNNQPDSAYKYLSLAQVVNDSINQRRIKSLAEFQKLNLDEQQRLQNVEKERVVYQNKIRTISY